MVDFNDPKLIEAFSKYVQEVADRRHAARDRAFPDHKGHQCEEIEVKYFDAMMTAVLVSCSCGKQLEIDRGHFECK